MRLRLSKLQKSDPEAQELKYKEQLLNVWEDIDGILHYQRLPFVLEVIQRELISRHHNDPLPGHFGVDKTRELVG